MLVAFPLGAQVTQEQARELLAQRGIPEDSLRNRLIKKGYDPDRIRPDQVSSFQTVIAETINEYEAFHTQPGTLPPARNSEPDQTDSQPPAPPPAQPEIETAVEDGGDHRSNIYGQDIFRNNSVEVFQKAEDIIPSDDYVLGTGDKLGVVGFGRSQFEEVLEIGPDGFVRPSGGLPRILLKGLRLGEAKEVLYQRYNQYYVMGRGQFQVTMTRPRNITVSVFGEAMTPGAYTLPGFNTAFNVISAAGGPTDIGSVRNIKVISGSHVRQLDVYEFMNDPTVARNFFLQSNDYIHIPVAQKVVTIQGAVTRPMSYELLDKENLSALLDFAGGLRPEGYLSDVKITRFLDDRQVITNVNFKELSEGGGDYILYHGDIVEIKTIDDVAVNFVSVNGAVHFPGRYERRPDMRISDLLGQSKLKPEARLDYAYLLRYQPDGTYKYERIQLEPILANPSSSANLLLGDQDELQVLTLKSFADLSFFTVSGAVRNPDTFSFTPDGVVRLEDAILLAGGLMREAADQGYILRSNPREPKTMEYIQVDIRQAFNEPGSDANLEIMEGDQVVVFDKSIFRDQQYVSVFGAVRNPGPYPYGPEMTVADLVNMAGGFLFGADNERIDVARLEITNKENSRITQYSTQLPSNFNLVQLADQSLPLEPYDHVYVRTIPEFEMQQTVLVSGEVRYPGVYTLLHDKERISDIIERAGGLTDAAFPDGAKMYRKGDATGLVVINLDHILHNETTPSNVVLLAGDEIEVPKNRDLVTIGGFVNLDDEYSEGFLENERSVSVAFEGEKSAKHYVDHYAAGVSKDGSASEIKVQYANGRVQKTKKFLFFNNYPRVERGSVITVGPKEVKPVEEGGEKEKIDWSIVLRDTLTQATAVLTILILVDQLGK
jgi:protein involved in polysaccharide export with SLBB domain